VADAILVLNSGSSSLKFTLFDADALEPLVRGQIESLQTEPQFRAIDRDGRLVGEHSWGSGASLGHAAALDYLLSWGRRELPGVHNLIGVGHRVVHGGTKFDAPIRVNERVLEELEALVPLAPLHQPHNLTAIRAMAKVDPGLPQIACFDTAFHCAQSATARMFAIPRRYAERGVQRYGFHGLSYEYIAGALRDIDAGAAAGRTIVAHLGNGASACAMSGGRSVATTMGLTALDGLVMGTRCGSIDPGVILYLVNHAQMQIGEVQRLLYEESGLLGVSGISGDMRTLLASADPGAREAVELFVYRLVREIGSLSAALGGLDAIVFTGGIGENAPAIREAVCGGSRWLGVELDESANARGAARISAPASRVTVLVIPTNEELTIARHTARVIGAPRRH
jgi:acetate kinase